MATKRDTVRATKFKVGSQVTTYPFQGDASGWSPVVSGTVKAIVSAPDVDQRDPGLFEVDWTYVGSSRIPVSAAIALIPNPIPGASLRFEER